MISMEEKKQLMDETVDKIYEALEAGSKFAKTDDEDGQVNSAIEFSKACDPLMQEYTKELMEVVNPFNPSLAPLLVYVLKTVLASIEKDMDEMQLTILELLQHAYRSVSMSIPNKD